MYYHLASLIKNGVIGKSSQIVLGDLIYNPERGFGSAPSSYDRAAFKKFCEFHALKSLPAIVDRHFER